MARGPRKKAAQAKVAAAAAAPAKAADVEEPTAVSVEAHAAVANEGVAKAKGVRKKGRRKEAERLAIAESAGKQDAVAAEAKKKGGKKRKRVAQPEEDDALDRNKSARRLQSWAEDSAKVDSWLQSRGGTVELPLKESDGGIVRLRDFMRPDLADWVLSILEGLPEEAWEVSEQGGDGSAANHRFWSADVCDIPELACLRSVFWKMLPKFKDEPTMPIISCARYGSTDHINRHDDRAHVPFLRDDNIYSRTAAAIWYLTKDWTEEEGGHLVDLEPKPGTPSSFVPIYNSLVLFEVPHWHAVSAVKAERYRYSIFGWWHQQGKRYDLPGSESNNQATDSAAPRKKKVKRKKVSS